MATHDSTKPARFRPPTPAATGVRLVAAALACAAVTSFGLASCYWEPSTYKPADAAFELACAPRCGKDYAGRALVVGVDYSKVRREFQVCCPEVPTFVAKLRGLRDGYCKTGEETAPQHIADLHIEAFESEIDGARGVKLDQGNGYVVFKCSEWLKDLIAKSEHSCCAAGGS